MSSWDEWRRRFFRRNDGDPKHRRFKILKGRGFNGCLRVFQPRGRGYGKVLVRGLAHFAAGGLLIARHGAGRPAIAGFRQAAKRQARRAGHGQAQEQSDNRFAHHLNSSTLNPSAQEELGKAP